MKKLGLREITTLVIVLIFAWVLADLLGIREFILGIFETLKVGKSVGTGLLLLIIFGVILLLQKTPNFKPKGNLISAEKSFSIVFYTIIVVAVTFLLVTKLHIDLVEQVLGDESRMTPAILLFFLVGLGVTIRAFLKTQKERRAADHFLQLTNVLNINLLPEKSWVHHHLKRLLNQAQNRQKQASQEESRSLLQGEMSQDLKNLDIFIDILPRIGLLGTVFGLVHIGFDIANLIRSTETDTVAEAIQPLLMNLGTAFFTTLFGLLFSTPLKYLKWMIESEKKTLYREIVDFSFRRVIPLIQCQTAERDEPSNTEEQEVVEEEEIP